MTILLTASSLVGVAEARGGVAAPAAELWAQTSETVGKIHDARVCNKEASRGHTAGYSDGFRVGSRKSSGVMRATGGTCYESGYRNGFSAGLRDGEKSLNPLAACKLEPIPQDRKVTVTYRMRC